MTPEAIEKVMNAHAYTEFDRDRDCRCGWTADRGARIGWTQTISAKRRQDTRGRACLRSGF